MSLQASYDALRHGMARVSRTDRGVVRLRGADRAAWLQGLVTNDLRGLAPGQRIYSAYLSPQGRMITDLWAVAAADALLLDVPAPLAASLAARLDGLIFAEDVQVDDASGELACTEIVGAAGEGGVSPSGVLVADHTYGRPALVVYGPAAAVLAEHGQSALNDVMEVGLDALDVLRVEAGVPRFLVDMTEDTIPLEAGIEDRAISFTKGCYVGQELIVRVTQRGGGRVAKKLVGLMVDAGTAPASAAPSLDAAIPIHAGTRAIGHVTSLVHSPALDRVIALGYVHRDFVEPGTPVAITLAAGPVEATVHALPFVEGS
jgi:folate-binding protein YgfZ